MCIRDSPNAVLADIRRKFSVTLMDSAQLDRGICTKELAEALAEMDDGLLEHSLNQGYASRLWLDFICKPVERRRLFPYFIGSALTGEGIPVFLSTLPLLALSLIHI